MTSKDIDKNYTSNYTKVVICVIMTAFCFSTLEIAGKIGGNSLDAFQFTFWRFVIGCLALLPITLRERRESSYKLTKHDILCMVGAGAICVPGSMFICQLGLMHANAATASVIISTNGMFTMIFAHFLANEKLTRKKASYVLLALVGLTFLICPWNIQPGNTMLGCGLTLLGAMTFGLYTIIGKKISPRTGAITQACISMFAGAILLLIIILAMGRPVMTGVIDNFWVILYAGIVVTGGGYFFMFTTIRLSDASTSAISFFLKPVLAPLLSVLILHETFGWNTYVGIAFVLLSSFLNLTAGRRAGSDNQFRL